MNIRMWQKRKFRFIYRSGCYWKNCQPSTTYFRIVFQPWCCIASAFYNRNGTFVSLSLEVLTLPLSVSRFYHISSCKFVYLQPTYKLSTQHYDANKSISTAVQYINYEEMFLFKPTFYREKLTCQSLSCSILFYFCRVRFSVMRI